MGLSTIYDGDAILFTGLSSNIDVTIQTTQQKISGSIDSTDASIFNITSKTLNANDNTLKFATYGQPEPEPEPEIDTRLIELFESFTIFDLTNTKQTSFVEGSIITTDEFVEKLNTDLQTTISYAEELDTNGDIVSYLEFNDITEDTIWTSAVFHFPYLTKLIYKVN